MAAATRSALVLAVSAVLLMALAAGATAKTCSDTAISAHGEASRYLWLAKTKARANWRRKVRATSGLGTEFSNWNNAETSEERCITGQDGTVCVFTGYPCRP